MKKIGAILLVAAMVIMMMPISVWAAYADDYSAAAVIAIDADHIGAGASVDAAKAAAEKTADSGAEAITTATVVYIKGEVTESSLETGAKYIVAGTLTLDGVNTISADTIYLVGDGKVVYTTTDGSTTPVSSVVTSTAAFTLTYTGDGTNTAPTLDGTPIADAAALSGFTGTALDTATATPTTVSTTGTATIEDGAAVSYPITANAIEISNATVNDTGSLTADTINVTGTLTNNGTINATTSTTVADGGSLANTGSFITAAMTVNGDGSSNDGTMNITGTLTIANGKTMTANAGTMTIGTVAFGDNTSKLARTAGATINVTTVTVDGAPSDTNDTNVFPNGVQDTTQPPVTPPTTTGPSYQIVWGNGGSNSTELWAKPSTSNPTGSDGWAKPSTDSNKTNPSMGGAR